MNMKCVSTMNKLTNNQDKINIDALKEKTWVSRPGFSESSRTDAYKYSSVYRTPRILRKRFLEIL